MALVNPKAIVSGYEVYIPALTLPDPDDRHVLATAIHALASHIVTYNLSDFPESILGYHNVEAIHPDIFLSALFDEKPEEFLHAVYRHRADLKNPPKSIQEYIDTLKANRLVQLATRIDAHRHVI